MLDTYVVPRPGQHSTKYFYVDTYVRLHIPTHACMHVYYMYVYCMHVYYMYVYYMYEHKCCPKKKG